MEHVRSVVAAFNLERQRQNPRAASPFFSPPRDQQQRCTHGCSPPQLLPPGHAVSSIIATLNRGYADGFTPLMNATLVILRYEKELKKEETLIYLKSWMVSDAVDLLLFLDDKGNDDHDGEDESPIIDTAMHFAESILALETHASRDGMTGAMARRMAKAHRDLVGNGRRGLLAFFQKRIPCGCLDEAHRFAKRNFAKMGQCHYCQSTKEHKRLYKCRGCGMYQYCSVVCQKADWPSHKLECKTWLSESSRTKAVSVAIGESFAPTTRVDCK